MNAKRTIEYNPNTRNLVDHARGEVFTLEQAVKLPRDQFQRLPYSYKKMFESFHDFAPLTLVNKPLQLNNVIDTALYDYQREDVKRVVYHMNGRALLAMAMGTGKTISSIAITDHFRNSKANQGKTKGLLVICPSYLRHNWQRELVKWNYCKEEEILLVMKTKDIEQDPDVLRTTPVVVVSYDLIVRNFPLFRQISWFMIIVDESAYLKNRETKRVRTIGTYLKAKSQYVLLLSGTPALNCPRELFVQLNILYPAYFPDYFDFSIRYCEGHRDYFGWNDRGSCKEKELNYILNQLMVRRLKKDVLKNLPKKQRQKVFLDVKITRSMQKNASKLQALNDELRSISAIDPDAPHYQKRFKERNTLISKMFTELSYVKKGVAMNFVEDLREEKAKTDHPKIILFAHHQHVLDSLEEMCAKRSWNYIRIDGTTAANNRQNRVDSFVDKDSGVDFAILSIKACNTGLNFTPVTTMVFVELLYEISTHLQAEDRINRIGALEDANMEYYYLVGTDTIDEKIFKSVGRKFKVLQKIFDDGNDVDGFNFVN